MSAPLDLELAQRMRANGQPWDAVGRHFGVSGEYVHRRLDPVWAAKRQDGVNQRRRERASKPKSGNRAFPEMSIEAKRDGERLLRGVPADTRNLTGKICGDPLPGRSALAARQVRQPNDDVNNAHTKNFRTEA